MQPLWIPAPISDAGGREIVTSSLLGPFFAVTVFAEEDPTVAEKYFNGKQSAAAVRTLSQQLQQDLEFLRTSLHKLMHAILANPGTRDGALDFLDATLTRNAKRQQMQVDERSVAGDGFMLNVLSAMQHLSARVKLDKIDPLFFFNPKSRVNIKEDTKLNMSEGEAEEWLKGLRKYTRDKVARPSRSSLSLV